MNLFAKILLTLIVLFVGLSPYLDSSNETGTLKTLFSLGIAGSVVLFAIFFIAIAFYCRELQNCLTYISASNRSATPKSVWYMFLIPFNFIEDFFIIISVSNSIEEEAKHNTKLSGINDSGLIKGTGWCIAQILSLIPNTAGQLAGFAGLFLWIIHWRYIIKINKLLKPN